MSNSSKRAIWLAVNSEHGNRLLEIAQEHTWFARELADNGKHMSEDVAAIYRERICQLRKERDAIILQFEGR